MYLPRILSITASVATLVIAAVALASHYEWHQYKEMRKHHHVLPWYALSDLVVTFVATVGFSTSLLAYSISWNERQIEILLLLFGRFLLMKHVSIYLCYRLCTN